MAAGRILFCANGHYVSAQFDACPACGAVLGQPAEAPEPAGAAETHDATRPLPGLQGAAGVLSSSDDPGVSGDRPQRARHGAKRPRRRAPVFVAAGLAALLVMTTAWWFLLRETDEDRYLAALQAGGFTAQYATPDVAVASGHAFCDSLAVGQTTEGYDYQKVAVDQLCPEFSTALKVIPTPEQQAVMLTTQLRDKGLGGKFPSDAAAVAHAESVCRALDEGAEQQGPEEDAVAVGIYCDKYSVGFKTLFPITVKGKFTLYDSDYSYFFKSIGGSASDCYGMSGYNDIGEGTEVLIKNEAGTVLTSTVLGRGKGVPPVLCKFTFEFTVMDGEKGGYYIEVSDRGKRHYTAAELKLPDAVSLYLG